MVGELEEVTMFLETDVKDLCVEAAGANASAVARMAAAATAHDEKRTILFLILLMSIAQTNELSDVSVHRMHSFKRARFEDLASCKLQLPRGSQGSFLQNFIIRTRRFDFENWKL